MAAYKPKIPKESVNYSKEHPLKDFLAMGVGLVVVVTIAVVSFDYISGFVIDRIPLKTEIEWFGNSKGRSKIEQSPQEKKLSNLMSKLWAPYSEEVQANFSIDIMAEKDMNAFTGVGAKFYFTTGLLDKTKSLNSLGFVICHELGHFYHRHVLRQSGRKIMTSLFLSLVGLGDMSEGLIGAGSAALSLKFSRDDERQADSFALDCQQKFFGHVNGFDEFFININKSEGAIPAFMSTHPKSLARIEELKITAIERGYSLEGELTEWQPNESENEEL
jgi:predicted Zn-dependent protease